jgi:hypothetical protein
LFNHRGMVPSLSVPAASNSLGFRRRAPLGMGSGGNGGASSGGRALALIPVFAMAIAATLMLPRSSVPDDVPLPAPDTRELAAIHAKDDARVAATREHPLSPELLTLGTAIRTFFRLGTHGGSNMDVAQARGALDEAVRIAAAHDGPEGMLTLRAVQLSIFLDEVAAFEVTGKSSDELGDISGNFVDRLRGYGWIDSSHVLLDGEARRAAYKTVWNQTVGADRIPGFALGVDEWRAFYAFTLAHPIAESHVPTPFEERRRLVGTQRECESLKQEEIHARAAWQLREIARVGAIDPAYPTQYARGVALFRLGDFPASAEAFRTYLHTAHDGALALRANNFMRAAIREATDVP